MTNGKSPQTSEYSSGYAAALALVEQEARRRAEEGEDKPYGWGHRDALTELAEFCRAQRGTP